MYTKKGYQVYVSSNIKYRSQDICDLVWKLNPFVKGFINDDGTPDVASYNKQGTRNDTSWIDNVHRYHGFDTNLKYPKIYYHPNILPNLKKSLLYDTTSITTNPSDSEINETFVKLISTYPQFTPIRINFPNLYVKNRPLNIQNEQTIDANSLYELADYINSCAVFITGFSGSSVLASSIKKDSSYPIIHSIIPKQFHAEFFNKQAPFIFPNIIYTT